MVHWFNLTGHILHDAALDDIDAALSLVRELGAEKTQETVLNARGERIRVNVDWNGVVTFLS